MGTIKVRGAGRIAGKGGGILPQLLLIILINSCQPADPLLATWKIERVTYEPGGRATPESLERGRLIQSMTAGLQNSTFALYENQRSAFFSTKTPYRQGTWSRDGDRLQLSLGESGTAYSFEIVDWDDVTLVMVLLSSPASDGELVIRCRKSQQYIHDGVDLLSPEANGWRTRPNQKETPEEVRLRTIRHLDYLITYFEGVKDKKQDFFETGIISSPFVFYAHGLGLSRETPFALRWRESFYDEANARQGFDYLRAAMRSLKKFPKADTYTEEYLLAFRQMRTYFDQ